MKCEACPVAGPCLGESRRELGLCAHAASGDPVLVRRVVDRNAMGPVLFRRRIVSRAELHAGAEASSVGLWEFLKVRDRFAFDRAAVGCPARVKDPSCGCCGQGCALHLRPVTWDDCRECVAPIAAATLRGLPSPRQLVAEALEPAIAAAEALEGDQLVAEALAELVPILEPAEALEGDQVDRADGD